MEITSIRRKYDTSVFEKCHLSNGITVWLQHSPILLHEGGILIVFLPQIGSQMDPSDRPGTAHFFEHIPFQGTRQKPSRKEVVEPVTKLGGEANARTTKFWTEYFVENLPSEQFELAAETLFTLSTEPIIDSRNIEKERGVISSEYHSTYSNGGSVTAKILAEKVFGRNHPLGHLPLGELGVIQSMSAEELQEFHRSHYHSGNIQVVCGGTFTTRPDALEIMERIFAGLPESFPTPVVMTDTIPTNSPKPQTIIEPRCGRDCLFLTQFVNPQTREKSYALSLLSWVLGGELESPLLVELREKRGLVYERGLCKMESSLRLWTWCTILPVASRHFDLAQEIYYEVLRSIDGDLLRKFRKKEQVGRRTKFDSSYKACDTVVEEVTDWGYPISYHEAEAYRDAVDIEEVLSWRDYLLNNTPLIFKIKTGE